MSFRTCFRIKPVGFQYYFWTVFFFYFSRMGHTDRKKLYKGIRTLAFALPLMALGPIGITLGFKSKNTWILIVGIALGILAVYLAFKGISRIMNAVFSEK